ncbi:LacI family DNA-binding transcriptional regulator [Pseudoalteromonas fenneropenaei]|uniref:LacI family DNA-binding transcriptional regulator n=1 Tax=Pseudoalteromonas fenneropenaei TaxID=1737459 RepID=A0ABV7CJD5_9GAMM
MSEEKKWTLKSIALHLGVSNATVSNAFNRPDQLSKDKRQQILKACEELGYFGPNKAAQSLRKGTSNIVALVLPDSVEYMVSDPVASSFMRGVAGIIEERGNNILLFSGTQDNLNNVVDFVDGFICYGRPRNLNLFAHLSSVTKPVVTVDFDLPNRASVNIDNTQAAYDAASSALTQPQAQVAILGLRLLDTNVVCRVYDENLPEDLGTSIAHQRLAGYQRALREKHLTFLPELLWSIPESSEKYATIAAQEALSLTPRPNVLLCMSDLIALAAMRVAKSKGIRVPEELKIVGFDGIQEALLHSPSITTIQQNSVEKGKTAALLFLERSTQKVQLGYKLIQGQSN